MESQTAPATGTAVDAANLAQALHLTAASHPDVVAVRSVDDAVSWTWAELEERAAKLAAGLAGLGVGHGDMVALMLTNRPEFFLCDLAALTLGAVPFSIYNTYPPDQIAFLVKDSGARVIVTEQAFLSRVLEVKRELPSLEHVLVADAPGADAPTGTMSLATVEGHAPAAFDVSAARAAVAPDDLATLIYTSGTTGPPKGVELTHANLMAAASSVEEIMDFEPGSRVISWLPAAHIAERMANYYIPLVFGGTVTVCPDPREIASFLPQVRPNWFFAVPRIWEKLKAGLETMLAAQEPSARLPLECALEASLKRVRLRQRGEPVPDELEWRVSEADKTMFAGVREMLGLDQLAAVNVGAAPMARDVLEFFHALGIEIAELWGMSETCGAGSCNRTGAVKIGTIGPPEPGIEARLGDDGELLVRGKVVMHGYRHAPEKTAEAIDADGWLHTGDIAEIDSDGYITLIDRKKELIINSAGKNMSPANIEAALKSGGTLIGQACVIGDRRPYNTALIVLDPDYTPVWAGQHGLSGSVTELAHNPLVLKAVQEAVDAANAKLSRVEQIKKFTVLGDEWAPGGDELTPTMKLKRKPIAAKYAGVIESMYT